MWTILNETGLSQIEAEVGKNLENFNQEFQNFENQKVPRSMILHLKAQAEFHEPLALLSKRSSCFVETRKSWKMKRA